MRADAEPVQARLALWRQSGADRLDPSRFRHIEALAARIERHQGAARALLAERLAALVEGYAADLSRQVDAPGPDVRATASAGGALAPLLAQLAARRQEHGATEDGQLPALADFRRLWSELLGERRLRQSLAPVPADAGPLNSGVLALRAIALMRDTSPEYLRHFLAYADHLCWLERLHESRTAAASAAPGTARRAAPRKPRKRRGD